MECPLCHAPLFAQATACGQCGVDLTKVDRAFGVAPQLKAGLNDLSKVLKPRSARVIADALHDADLRLPQCHFAVVLSTVPADWPWKAYTFWLFNRGGLVAAMEKGGACRQVLLTLDTEHQRCACMVGYGLEPFVSAGVLQGICDRAMVAFQGRAQSWEQGIIGAVEHAVAELSRLSQSLRQTYGLHGEISDDEVMQSEFVY